MGNKLVELYLVLLTDNSPYEIVNPSYLVSSIETEKERIIQLAIDEYNKYYECELISIKSIKKVGISYQEDGDVIEVTCGFTE